MSSDREILKAWQRGVILDRNHPASHVTAHPSWTRWRLFTDDELARLDDCIFIANQAESERTGRQMSQATQDLHSEVLAELERRRIPS